MRSSMLREGRMAEKTAFRAMPLVAGDPNLEAGKKRPKSGTTAMHLRSGDLCPQCRVERLDYDGLLNLSCPRCGTVDGAWGGCS